MLSKGDILEIEKLVKYAQVAQELIRDISNIDMPEVTRLTDNFEKQCNIVLDILPATNHTFFPNQVDEELSRVASYYLVNYFYGGGQIGSNHIHLHLVSAKDKGDTIEVTITTSRPGVVIGYKGETIAELESTLEQKLGKPTSIKIKESAWHNSDYVYRD